MKICLAGEGAQGITHVNALRTIEGIEIVSLAGGIEEDAAAFARQWNIPHYSLNLEECLQQPGVEAVILGTPNHVHCEQVELAMSMGKHALVEIPMGLTLEEARRITALEEKTGLVCMVCHTLRYSPAHREMQRRVRNGDLHLHHIISQTYFFRRENTNRFGKPRTWTDDLLWHQACHMVDFIYWLFDDPDMEVWGQVGPNHPELGVPMDLTIGMRSKQGCIVSGVLSFNNHGSIDISYRFIGEEETFLLEKGKLVNHDGNKIELGEGGVEMQDREFFDAIAEKRQPLTSCKACLPTMEMLDRIQRSINEKG